MAYNDMASKVQQVLDPVCQNLDQEGRFGGEFLQNLRVASVTYDDHNKAVVTFSVHTEPWMRNAHGNVHGGCIATMVDMLTSLSVCADKKFWPSPDTEPYEALGAYSKEPAVSRNLSCQYLKAVPIGIDVKVECHVQSYTKRYSYITCRLIDDTGKLFVTASHDRVHLYQKL